MTRNEIFAVVQKIVVEVIEGARGQEITENSSMRDFGADSLEIVEVVSRSMRQLKVKIPRAELAKAQNLGDLVSLLEEAAARATVG